MNRKPIVLLVAFLTLAPLSAHDPVGAVQRVLQLDETQARQLSAIVQSWREETASPGGRYENSKAMHENFWEIRILILPRSVRTSLGSRPCVGKSEKPKRTVGLSSRGCSSRINRKHMRGSEGSHDRLGDSSESFPLLGS